MPPQEESDDEEEEAPKPAAKKAKTQATPAAAPAAPAEEEEDDGNVGIFIKNLPWKVTEDDVAEFFADAGEVVNVRLGEPPPLCPDLSWMCFRICGGLHKLSPWQVPKRP